MSVKIFLLYLVAGLFLSCHSYGREKDKNVLAILSEFTFVGSGPAKFDDKGEIDGAYIIPHGENEQPKPQNLTLGVQYVFHHRAPVDNESLALQDLPDKIEGMGFKIVKAPKSADKLLYMMLGGPLFYISFSDGDREFEIFNQLDTSVSDGWAIHDYVLIRIR
jgi:hypothetical protein